MSKECIRVAGVGGQGVVLSGIILGRSASVYENKNAVQTQSYGSSARGGDVTAEIIISDEDIVYPKILKSDFFVALSQEAFLKYKEELRQAGVLIVDSDLVEIKDFDNSKKIYKESFNKRAIDEYGSGTFANIIMLGYFVNKTGLLSPATVKKTVEEMVPAGTEKKNLQAFEMGMQL